MNAVEILIDFSDWNETVDANVPGSLYRLEYLTRKAFGGEPNLAYDHYVATNDDYEAHAVLRVPNDLSILEDTQKSLIRSFAEDTWGSRTIYRWDTYANDWRLV